MVKKKLKSSSKKKVTKVIDNTVKEKKVVKVVDFYQDIFSYRQYPVTEAFIDRLCQDWVVYVRDTDDCIKASEYILTTGVSWDTWMRWGKTKFPQVLSAHNVVKLLIGNRREKKLVAHNPNQLAFMMPHYDEDYKEQYEWRASLKSLEQSDERRDIVINIPDYSKD